MADEHDFDFIFGEWQIHNRKLRDVTDPDCTEWIEFDATGHAEPIFGGLGHIDRMFVPTSAVVDGFEGLAIRQFDPAARVWRIWWASSWAPGHIDPPMEGIWADGRGVFYGDDMIGGRSVKLRFEWTTDDTHSATWQQSFSYNGGVTWGLNWVMDFSRR
ncbi:hypothetical protein GCM10027413_27600 [Conyzicola nivalis]|uniref:DUF1579 domain-containing protein n=1 Tax=Conyzicola nivalis TaxID=1477021 RepID=A0A916SV46_9MICO|nr:hypothetical protein [Conyzicola nivalis]GGB14939.1 hypothetical protein GCM10010979_31910 [Conyzicola nivalis]